MFSFKQQSKDKGKAAAAGGAAGGGTPAPRLRAGQLRAQKGTLRWNRSGGDNTGGIVVTLHPRFSFLFDAARSRGTQALTFLVSGLPSLYSDGEALLSCVLVSRCSPLRPSRLVGLADITDIDMPPSMALSFPNGASDMMHLGLSLSPPEGPYHPGTFYFSITIPDGYPHSPPKVHCDTKVFHPNIDLEGHVCLNILRQDWKPVLTLSAVLYGLQLLFLEPNADDPLNSEAAEALKAGGAAWERLVAKTLRGGYVGGTRFDKVV